jgi:hypothetical protein
VIEVLLEAAELLLDVDHRPRVVHGGFNLAAVANDAGVAGEGVDPVGRGWRRARSKSEGFLEAGPLGFDDLPAMPDSNTDLVRTSR